MGESEHMAPCSSVPSDDDTVAALRASISGASFWSPQQLGPQPAWLEHAPFAFWLIEALRPRVFVELGTHGGFSYFAVCQAVQRLGLEMRCYAVDLWKGDEHAGFYGEEVYDQVRTHNEKLYSAFSTLIRSSFADALGRFDDATIDLLHIDGRHFYAGVKEDFESWLPKLSRRAVVLFHDTNIHERDFGVFKLWEEIRARYPHFEFTHGHGLGVLGVGSDLPPPIRLLFAAGQDVNATKVSIVIPSAFTENMAYQCITGLLRRTTSANFEICLAVTRNSITSALMSCRSFWTTHRPNHLRTFASS